MTCFGSAMALADLRPKSKTAAGPGKATGYAGGWTLEYEYVHGFRPATPKPVFYSVFMPGPPKPCCLQCFDTPDWLARPQMLQIEIFLVYYSYLSFLSNYKSLYIHLCIYI